MADAAPPKRVLPARERRESAAKRRVSSPIPAPKPTTPRKGTAAKSTPRTAPAQKHGPKKTAVELSPLRRSSTPVLEEILPTKISDAKPLPTSRQRQRLHLSTAEYRSIAESAVLAASLYRSRVQWLCDGILERYWTKPSKKKGAAEVSSNNPDQKSMQKLGICTVTIEPHTFDGVIYTVRDPNGPPAVHYRHPNQYPQQPPPPLQNYYPAGPPLPVQPNLQARPQQAQPSPAPSIKQEPGSAPSQPPSAALTKVVQATGAPGRPPSSGNGGRQPPAASTASAPPPAKANADPVIQMLATRAATDPALKELMKVVASSKASQDQLKQFQGHIDELNEIIRRQQAEKEEKDQDSRKDSPATQPPTQLDGANSPRPPSGAGTPIQPSLPHNAPRPPPPPPPPPPSYPLATHPASAHHPPPMPAHAPGGNVAPLGVPHQPPYPHYAPPPPRIEPRIKHIVVEFTTPASGNQAASQDRWLFPEYAVLDTPLSGRGLEMVCSFFVVRKGSQILAAQQQNDAEDMEAGAPSKWKPNDEYYQAVTMTLKAPVHRTLETIARAAKPLPEVQAFMRTVMEEKKRAPVEYLALRLPREKDKVMSSGEDVAIEEGTEFVDSGVEVGSPEEDDELKDYYGI